MNSANGSHSFIMISFIAVNKGTKEVIPLLKPGKSGTVAAADHSIIQD